MRSFVPLQCSRVLFGVATHFLQGDDEDVCWICLENHLPGRELVPMPCKCPRFVHSKCIMRWQLQSAGSRKETNCEFCDEALPDWKDAIQDEASAVAKGAKVTPIMKVRFNGITKGFAVTPGPEGKAKFKKDIHEAFDFPPGMKLNITFTCMEPTESSQSITLSGERCFDAAVVCASVAAAKRISHAEESGPAASPSPSPANKQESRFRFPLEKFTDKLRCVISELSCVSVQAVQ